MTTGEYVFRRRREMLLSRPGLARLMRVNRNTIGKWERDKVAMSESMRALLDMLVEKHRSEA